MSPVKPTASPAISQSAYLQQAQHQNGVQQQPTRADVQAQATTKLESNSSSEAAITREQTQEAQPESEEKTPADNTGMGDTELPPLDDMGMDVDMGSLVNDPDEGDQTPAANDWIMVDDQTEQNTGGNDQTDGATAQPGDGSEGAKEAAESTSIQAQQPTQTTTFEQPSENPQMDDNAFGGDFDNVDVDTAGDALASYGDENDDDLDLGGMDDSAFGDAFHPDPDQDGDIS